MKRMCGLLCLLGLLVLPALAQVKVGEVDINSLNIDYCELTIKGVGLGMSGNVEALIDYGQDRSLLKKNLIKDEKGEDMRFNGLVDVLNFMARNGWYYEDSWTLGKNDQLVLHYVLRKKKTS